MSVVVPLVVTTDLSFFMEREVLLTRKPLKIKCLGLQFLKLGFLFFGLGEDVAHTNQNS
jgi:hypothetical protein